MTPTPSPKPPRLLPFAILVGFIALCVLAVMGHVDMKESATAALVGMILGGLLDMLHRIVRYYYRDDQSNDDED